MRFMLFSLMLANFLFGYISATDGGFNKENQLIYTNNLVINVKSNKIILDGELPFDHIIFPIKVKQLVQIKKDRECSEQEKFLGKNKCFNVKTYDLVAFKELLNYILYVNKKEFYVKIDDKTEKAVLNITFDTLDNKVLGKIKVKKYELKIKNKNVLTIYFYPQKQLLVRLDVNGKKFELKRINNKFVEKYIYYLKTKKTVLNNFDFYKEPIFAKYKATTKDGIRYLKTTFTLKNKKNSIFEIDLKGSSLILEPQKNIDVNYDLKAFLIDSSGILFEYKKLLKINNQFWIGWVQKPGSLKIGVIYKNEDGKKEKVVIIKGSKPLYDFAGVWYLVSWMDKYNKNMMKISFVDTSRIEGIIVKENNEYKVKIATGNSVKYLWKFKLDKYHRVIEFEDVKFRVVAKLQGQFMTKTIQKNIQFLENYKASHHLKDIKWES